MAGFAIATEPAPAASPAGRQAGLAQGWTLVATAWLAVIATSLIAPVLPRIAAHFAATPGAADLVQLTVALPALFVALLAGPIGVLTDRVGRRVVLLVALVFYGVLGMAPLVLDSLPAILVTRCGVGAAEAAVMTAGTALLGDYYQGASRERWFAVQMGSANLVAVGVLVLGGALGEVSWRAPFAVYVLPFLLMIPVLLLTWEPVRAPRKDPVQGQGAALAVEGERLTWRRVLATCGVTLFGSMAFYVVIIQFSFILTAKGYSSPAMIGLGAAAASVAVPLGSVLFRVLASVRVAVKLAIAFAIASAGLILVALGSSYAAIVFGAALNGLGCGLYLPTLLTWAVAGLRPEERGRGSGAWQTAFFLGQFLSPITVIQLSHGLGGAAEAVMTYGVLCAIAAAIALAAAAVRKPVRSHSSLGVAP